MTKRLSALVAAATLCLSAAAFAQTSTSPTQPPSAAPNAPSATGQTAPGSTGAAGRPTTSQSGAPTGKALSEADVRQELEKQGYTRVSDVKKKGDHFEAKGMKDGKQVSLNVDAKTGKVVAR